MIKKLSVFTFVIFSIILVGDSFAFQAEQYECDNKTIFLIGTIKSNNLGDDEIRKMVTEIEEYCKDKNRTLAGFTEKKIKLEAMIDEYNAKQERQKKTGVFKKIEPLTPKVIGSTITTDRILASDMIKKLDSDFNNNKLNKTEVPELIKPLKPKLIDNTLQADKILTLDIIKKTNVYNNTMELNNQALEKQDENKKTLTQEINASTYVIKEISARINEIERSVWKNADGNFNTSRLVSDSVAGVVLGTAGGLITSSIIKKNQTENGFENINCTVGNQIVAGWGDEFRVGIK